MKEGIQDTGKQFVEEVGAFFKLKGLPRMAGRIFGWLLISGVPHQTAGEIAETLTVSRSSVSAAFHLLIEIGLIKQVARLGTRHDYFQVRPDSWHYFTKQELEQLAAFRQLAERGLKLMEGKAPRVEQPLEGMRDLCTFFEQELGTLLKRWQ